MWTLILNLQCFFLKIHVLTTSRSYMVFTSYIYVLKIMTITKIPAVAIKAPSSRASCRSSLRPHPSISPCPSPGARWWGRSAWEESVWGARVLLWPSWPFTPSQYLPTLTSLVYGAPTVLSSEKNVFALVTWHGWNIKIRPLRHL